MTSIGHSCQIARKSLLTDKGAQIIVFSYTDVASSATTRPNNDLWSYSTSYPCLTLRHTKYNLFTIFIFALGYLTASHLFFNLQSRTLILNFWEKHHDTSRSDIWKKHFLCIRVAHFHDPLVLTSINNKLIVNKKVKYFAWFSPQALFKYLQKNICPT